MSRYIQSSNPFEDDEDDGDFVMVGKPNSTRASSNSSRPEKPTRNPMEYKYNSSQEDNPFEDRRAQLQRQIDNSENTQLESTQRALASIYDSEAMGVATAEELLRQGETLNNIENKTQNMQQNLKTSQRHLNNIKSVFGGIKNWWTGDKKTDQTNTEASTSSRLRSQIEISEKQKPDTSGFYEDDLDSRFMAGARTTNPSQGGQYAVISPVTRTAREAEVDQNLVMMADGMSRLKGLAIGLGDEIERQNEQLDKINDEVGKTDDLLGHQNSQMRKILKR